MLKLIEAYPEFEALYREVYEMCLDMERMMRIFSKELEELDKNTVQYMIDEMQDTIDAQKEQLNQMDEQLNQKDAQLNRKDAQLNRKDEQLNQQKEQLNQQKEQLNQAIIQGIHAFILDNLEEGVPRERILLKLQKRFDLTEGKADAYFAEVAEG